FFFFSSRRRHTRSKRDWSSDVCSSDLFPPDPKYQRKAFGYLALPIHTDFLWNRGAYIMEILNLDELAKDQAYEFLFVLGPLLLRGGIGVPINPIAIR